MSIRLGLALCVFAGCSLQPAREASGSLTTSQRLAGLDAFAHGSALCVGVEHLPPGNDHSSPTALPTAGLRAGSATIYAPQGPSRFVAAQDDRRQATTTEPRGRHSTHADLALQFLDDLQGRDRFRLRREFMALNLPTAANDEQSPGIPLRADERAAEDAEERLGETGHQIVRRPIQQLLRRTAVVSRVELKLADLADLPAERSHSDEAHDDVDLGRLTMVVRPNRMDAPVEIGYRRSGFVIATSQQQLKCGITLPIAESVFLELRARQLFLDDSWQLRAELRWMCSQQSSVHLVCGDDLLIPSEATPYGRDPMAPTGVLGIQLYAVHRF